MPDLVLIAAMLTTELPVVCLPRERFLLVMDKKGYALKWQVRDKMQNVFETWRRPNGDGYLTVTLDDTTCRYLLLHGVKSV